MASAVVKQAPKEHTFKLHKTSIEIKDLPELAEALEIMSEESFSHHVSERKNDFAIWVQEVLHDDELAERLRGIEDKKQALSIVKQRLKEKYIPGSQYSYKAANFGFNLADIAIGFVGGIFVGLCLGYYLR
jgi:hypothetical protein